MGCTGDQVLEVLGTVGFGPDKKAKPEHATSTLSGGWRMKLALARAMVRGVTCTVTPAIIYSNTRSLLAASKR